MNWAIDWEKINNSVSMTTTRWPIQASITRTTADLEENDQDEGQLERLARAQIKIAYHCPRAYTESDPSIINRGTGYVEPCNQTTHVNCWNMPFTGAEIGSPGISRYEYK